MKYRERGMSSTVWIIVSLGLSSLCCLSFVFFFLLIIGIVMLRRRGKKKITVKEAVSAGAESVSQVFVRGKGGLQGMDDDDDDDK